MAIDIIEGAESPGEAWSRIIEHYRATGLKERRRFTVDFHTTKTELRGHPLSSLLPCEPGGEEDGESDVTR